MQRIPLKALLSTHQKQKPKNNPSSAAKHSVTPAPAGRGETHPHSLPRAAKPARYLLEVPVPKPTLKGAVKHTKHSLWLWCLTPLSARTSCDPKVLSLCAVVAHHLQDKIQQLCGFWYLISHPSASKLCQK